MLTESSEMRKLRGVVRHGAHDPICGRLPHRVEEAAEDVQPDATSIPLIVDVYLVEVRGCNVCAGVLPVFRGSANRHS